MRKISIVLLIMILTRIISFSSNISPIISNDSILVSTIDIKYANLIFNEHNKLLTENSLLNEQVENLTTLNNHLEEIDSLRLKQVLEYHKLTHEYADQIDNLNKEIKKKNNIVSWWQIGGITVSAGLLLLLLLK